MQGRFWVAGAAIAYGLVGTGMSLGGCAEAQAGQLRRSALREVSGKVARVDAAQRQVALEIRGVLTSFRIDEGTVFFLPGRVATLADLTEGLPVRAIYEPGGSPALLQWLELLEAPAPQAGSSR